MSRPYAVESIKSPEGMSERFYRILEKVVSIPTPTELRSWQRLGESHFRDRTPPEKVHAEVLVGSSGIPRRIVTAGGREIRLTWGLGNYLVGVEIQFPHGGSWRLALALCDVLIDGLLADFPCVEMADVPDEFVTPGYASCILEEVRLLLAIERNYRVAGSPADSRTQARLVEDWFKFLPPHERATARVICQSTVVGDFLRLHGVKHPELCGAPGPIPA